MRQDTVHEKEIRQMREYRISKYDPAYRLNGIYQRKEWTSIADVGSSFDGLTLTMGDYLAVEQSYIRFLAFLAEKSKALPLRISNLEGGQECSWKEGQMIDSGILPMIAADCLRENCWCKLLSESYFIHFGYDYYVYVGCDLPPDEIRKTASRFGLFVEECFSPYHDDN